MSITEESVSEEQGIQWQILMLLTGLAIAFGAATAAGAFERENPRPQAHSASPAVHSQAPSAVTAAYAAYPPGDFVYIIATTAVEAERIQRAVKGVAATMQDTQAAPPDAATYQVMVFEHAEEEARFWETIEAGAEEVALLGVRVRTIDLRADVEAAPAPPQAKPRVYIVASVAAEEALTQRLSGRNELASIFVAEPTRYGQELYNTLAGDEMQFGTFELIDLRE